jgi:hypothetical protein
MRHDNLIKKTCKPLNYKGCDLASAADLDLTRRLWSHYVDQIGLKLVILLP